MTTAIDQYTADLNAAENKRDLAFEDLQEAEANRAHLRSRLAKGDASVTAAQLSKADSEIARCELLHSAACNALDRLRRSPAFHPLLAEVIAEDLDGALGFPVSMEASEDEDMAFGIVQQVQPHTQERDGLLTGEVTFVVNRDPLVSKMNAEDVLDALRKTRRYVVRSGGSPKTAVRSRNLRDGRVQDSLRIIVDVAWERLPLVAEPNVTYGWHGLSDTNVVDGMGQPMGKLSTRKDDISLTTRTEGNITYTTVKARVLGTPVRTGYIGNHTQTTAGDLWAIAQRRAKNLPGTAHRGLGYCTEARVISFDYIDGLQVEVTYQSRQS